MKSVTVCGCRRFRAGIRRFEVELRKLGVIVYSPYLNEGKKEWENFSSEYKRFIALGLTHDHFYKIRMADIIFVYNPGGYSGVSTTLEIGYAVAAGKPIYALESDEELCRLVFFRETIASPQELVKTLT